MFTPDNTTGYTASELDALNVELAAILAATDENDEGARYAAEQAFADAVSHR